MKDKISKRDFENTLDAVLNRENDARVVAVMAASFCEDYLARLIRIRMPGLTRALKKTMFEEGVLASASSRAQMARALDLIDADCHHDLSRIARIRNLFAHNIYIGTFDHEDVEKLCGELR